MYKKLVIEEIAMGENPVFLHYIGCNDYYTIWSKFFASHDEVQDYINQKKIFTAVPKSDFSFIHYFTAIFQNTPKFAAISGVRRSRNTAS